MKSQYLFLLCKYNIVYIRQGRSQDSPQTSKMESFATLNGF